MEKMKMETANITDENIRKIEALFPNCITETVDGDGNGRKVINFELLRQMLSTDIVEGEETYEFTWVGKKAAIIEANRPTRKTLRPVIEESLDWDTTGNLYLEGDNLEVLKLLQESYLGKVKMIYIDPPYNTGSDFVYPDSFVMTSEDYNEGTGYFDEDGNVNFSRENGAGAARYHSDWCSMMYSRLMLARNLLAEDGAMFISIGDNESTNLTKICDELFGAANRIALICHKSRASVSNDKIISPNHNTILFYAKNIVVLENRRKMIGLDPVLDGFDYDDNDGRGEYRLVPVDGPGGAKKGNPHYEFLGVEGYWRFSKETMQEKYEDGLVVKRGNSLYQKYYKSTAAKTRKTATTWWDDAGLMSTATSRLKSLMGEATFDTPKPLELIDRMLRMITFEDKDSIVLDFFAGSSTTAHALMQYNAETEGNRKFILVQLPEPCAEKSEAKQNGWNDICEIGRERIKRAGKQIKTEYPAIADKLDVGFRVFKLDESNMNDVYYSAGEYTQGLLSMLESNVKADRTDLDLLFGCLLEWGLPLSMPYTSEELEGCAVHTHNEGDLIACFDENIPDTVIKKIANRQPLRAVFRDSSFNGSPAKINVGEIFKMLAPDTRVKVI